MPRPIDAASPKPRRTAIAGKLTEPIIPRELYRPSSLLSDCDRLSQPAEAMADGDILSFLIKYFHASLYPGSESHTVPLDEASDLLARFYDLWTEDGDRNVPLASDHSAYPLRMLADLPRTAHIFRSVAKRALPIEDVPDPYYGIDCGTGSGILLVAAWFQAKRNGCRDITLTGIEYDTDVTERTGMLFESLGIGSVVNGDARDPAILAGLPAGDLAFVANENVPAPVSRITAEPFSAIHAALFSAMTGRLRKAIFFPEALIVRDRDAELDVVLSKNNRFQPPRHFRFLRLRPRSIVIEGRLTRLWLVGKEFRKYIPEAWLHVMPGRW